MYVQCLQPTFYVFNSNTINYLSQKNIFLKNFYRNNTLAISCTTIEYHLKQECKYSKALLSFSNYFILKSQFEVYIEIIILTYTYISFAIT